ncbi:hypothetical protein [Cytophaga aurantiaca]|uniref:hypothetical protein n=1 Tax=Cytophaga aurantiaca TaxID=29530 RepID=UPI000379EA04|nr:hypothetical protein [Cytophaga aurantiaca]
MKINTSVLGLLLIAVFSACENKIEQTNTEPELIAIDSLGPKKNPISQEFPKEIPLKKVKSTEFILTLENKLSDSLNSIYSPTMLFAWQEIKNYYKTPIEISPENSLDFKLINRSNTFQNVLNKDEYETTVSFIDGIEVSAYFKKALPFVLPFHTQDEPLDFNRSKVRSFGLNYPDNELHDYFQILYYLDDDHFAIKLFPADTSSEIILAKGINISGTFSDLVVSTNNWIKKGDKEKNIKEKLWRYGFQNGDHLIIPAIKFNIGTNYPSLEGQSFTSGSTPHAIVKTYQQTAFIFDEYGAIIESEATITCDTTCVLPTPVEKPIPKQMIFDKPFVIFIKKKDSPNPYFAMKVMNAELMEKK